MSRRWRAALATAVLLSSSITARKLWPVWVCVCVSSSLGRSHKQSALRLRENNSSCRNRTARRCSYTGSLRWRQFLRVSEGERRNQEVVRLGRRSFFKIYIYIFLIIVIKQLLYRNITACQSLLCTNRNRWIPKDRHRLNKQTRDSSEIKYNFKK